MTKRTNPAQKPRAREIDVLKAMLIVGMICAHTFALVAGTPARTASQDFRELINLVSFSGFLFCFGYAAQVAYFSEKPELTRIYRPAARTLSAYYISAFAYLFFVERNYFIHDWLRVITLSSPMPYSEFLLAFGLTLALSALLYRPIQLILERPVRFALTLLALLLTTFLPTAGIQTAQIALLIGGAAVSFPVVQYFQLFLMGMYAARQDLHPPVWIGLAGAAAFIVYRYAGLGPLQRFPPDLAWILGSAFFTLTWYAAARFIDRWDLPARLLATLGENALFYLLASNLMIFAFAGSIRSVQFGVTTTMLIALGILATIYFMTTIVRRPVAPQESAGSG
jgi:hypothetical protein